MSPSMKCQHVFLWPYAASQAAGIQQKVIYTIIQGDIGTDLSFAPTSYVAEQL